MKKPTLLCFVGVIINCHHSLVDNFAISFKFLKTFTFVVISPWLRLYCMWCISHLLLFSHSIMPTSLRPPWTVALQAPLSMGFSRQEYWSGLPFPSPGDLPDPGIKPVSPALQTDSLPLSHLRSPVICYCITNYLKI